MKRSLCFSILLLLGVIEGAFAAQSSRVRSLAGLTAVRIIVEDLNPAMQKTGLRKEHLAKLIGEQLDKHGIASSLPLQSEKGPVLYVRLSSVIAAAQDEAPIGLYLMVQVKQWASLTLPTHSTCGIPVDPGSEPLLVTTWENGTMVMTNRKDLFFYVKQVLINLLADFAQDSRTATSEVP